VVVVDLAERGASGLLLLLHSIGRAAAHSHGPGAHDTCLDNLAGISRSCTEGSMARSEVAISFSPCFDEALAEEGMQEELASWPEY
jgi:hypothetical protein